VRLELKFNNFKDILLHNSENNNFHAIIKVPPSRFVNILSYYFIESGVYIDNIANNYADNYTSFILSKLREKDNTYMIVKLDVIETKSNCTDCDCNKKRYINPETNKCYYREAIENNYTTKIK